MNTFQIHSNEDLADFTPGLSFVHPTNNAAPFLRGIGFFSGTPGNEPGVAFYVDGVYFPSPETTVHTFNQNLDHIEVLKGPQGTLYGRNAAGGVIQIITKDPTQEPRADVNLGYSNYRSPMAEVYVTGGLTPNLAADLSAHYDQSYDGWGTNLTTGRKIYFEHEYSFRSKWVWRPVEAAKITFAVDYSDVRNDQGATVNILPGTVSSAGFAPKGGFFDTQAAPFVGTNLLPFGGEKQDGVMLKGEYDLSWAHLMEITAYRTFKGENVVDNDATPPDLAGGNQFQRGRTLTQEFQILSQPRSKLKWMAGVFLFDDNQGEHPVINEPSLIHTYDNQRVWSWAPFAQATYPIFTNTRVTGGVRYTQDDKHQTGIQLKGDGSVLAQYDHSIDANKITYLVSADHDFTSDILGYVSLSRGFRSGNFNNLNPAASPTRPQTVDAVEVGLKTQWLDRRLRVNLAAYDYRLKDIVVQFISQGLLNGAPVQNNAARGEIKGVDFDIAAAATSRLTVTLSGSLLDTKFTSFPNAVFFFPCAGAPTLGACAPNATLNGVKLGWYTANGNANGNPLPYSEKANVTGSANYDFDALGGILRFAVAASYHSGLYFDPQKAVKQSPYTNLDASIKWISPDKSWDVQVYGKNITDNHTYANVSLQTTTWVYSASAPARFGVQLGYHFR